MTADTGRPDYDATLKMASLQPGEPIFVLRAGDSCAADTVRAWAALAHGAGAPAEAVELALQQADRMAAWPTQKAPDGPDIAENQRLQLRYQFSRRAWTGREIVPSIELVMAEQLGQSAVVGRVRPMVVEVANAIARRQDPVPALRPLFALVGRDLDAAMRDAVS